MVRMIHKRTGIEFLVDESRVDEYLKRGHKLAEEKKAAPKKAAKKKTTKKTTKKK